MRDPLNKGWDSGYKTNDKEDLLIEEYAKKTLYMNVD